MHSAAKAKPLLQSRLGLHRLHRCFFFAACSQGVVGSLTRAEVLSQKSAQTACFRQPHDLDMWHWVLNRTKASNHREHQNKKAGFGVTCSVKMHWVLALVRKNHCAFWEQSETERSGTLQNCQMILQLSQTQQQIHCKQWLFCPTTTTKMGFRYHFFRLQREKWFNEFCYCSHSSNNKRPHSVEGWCCFCNLGVKCVLCIAACIVTATVRLTPHWPSQSWCPG